eukprot:c16297_g1_i1 orf=329-1366(-)
MMGANYLLLCCVLAALPSLHAWGNLSPPAGNSLAIKTKSLNAEQFYRCVDGDWLLEASYATLVDFYDPIQVVGNYSWAKTSSVPRYAGTWYLLNNAGDHAESGDYGSLVAGKEFMTARPASQRDLPDFLSIASSHENGGAASLVSYIARVKTKGGIPLDNGDCQWEDKVIRLPYDAEFHFWKQDLVPPNAPAALTILSDRAIQGVFGQGIVTYAFSGLSWTQKGIAAQLYDVPGGKKVGSFFIRETADYKGGSSCWHFDDPNGFEVVGKHACDPIQVTPGCLPWSLNEITTSSHKSTMFGDYSHVQMVSTTGGLPPASLAALPKEGQVYKSSFTAIYWLYCKSTY